MSEPLEDPHFFKKARLCLNEPFNVDGFELTAAQVIGWLMPFITDERAARMREVVARRQMDFFTVLENIYDRGNISAVMRSAEAFGFIRFHVIEAEDARFKAANRVARGADKWVDVQTFSSTRASVESLRAQGVKIYATSLQAKKDISEIDFLGPSALVIGNEKDGITPEMAELADEVFKIDMAGFSQSFNLSVAAALCLFHVNQQRKARGSNLSEKQKEMLLANYLLRTVENPGRLIAHLGTST
jgi:tRNA (guanosine-2'-O-)-methyltransferase